MGNLDLGNLEILLVHVVVVLTVLLAVRWLVLRSRG